MRLKKIHSYLFFSFLGTFLSTFLISMVFFIMQFLWVWIDVLIGKGLEIWIVLKLLLFVSATLVPMALPLSILISSTMILGKFGESNELAAIKSAGMSLFKFTRPLFIFIFFLSIGSFFFSNHVISYCQLKYRNLLKNIYRKEPSVNIMQDVFSPMGDYAMKVARREKDSLERIIIYEHDENKNEVLSTILAEKGRITSSPSGHFIILDLINGTRKQKVEASSQHIQKMKQPFTLTKYKTYKLHIDLSQLGLEDLEEEKHKTYFQMLNVSQLSAQIDTLQKERENKSMHFKNELNLFDSIPKYFNTYKKVELDTVKSTKGSLSNLQQKFEKMSFEEKNQIYQKFLTNFQISKQISERYEIRTKYDIISQAEHLIAIHQKFTFAVSCFVFFLIGAPLGAIIRKGGLGLPIVFGIMIFLIYYVLNMVFKKMGEESTIIPWISSWIPISIIFPIGLFLFFKSNKDSSLMNLEFYYKMIKKVFPKNKK